MILEELMLDLMYACPAKSALRNSKSPAVEKRNVSLPLMEKARQRQFPVTD